MSKSIQIKAGTARQETALTVALGIHINTSIKHYTPCLKKTVQTYFLPELCQISTDCKIFLHQNSRENRLV